MIVRTLDIFCDYPQCADWASGVTSANATPIEARRNAIAAGWRRRVFTNAAGLTKAYDLCPNHAEVEVVA